MQSHVRSEIFDMEEMAQNRIPPFDYSNEQFPGSMTQIVELCHIGGCAIYENGQVPSVSISTIPEDV